MTDCEWCNNTHVACFKVEIETELNKFKSYEVCDKCYTLDRIANYLKTITNKEARSAQ